MVLLCLTCFSELEMQAFLRVPGVGDYVGDCL